MHGAERGPQPEHGVRVLALLGDSEVVARPVELSVTAVVEPVARPVLLEVAGTG